VGWSEKSSDHRKGSTFLDCFPRLELHKLTVFTADAAKRQWYYIQQKVQAYAKANKASKSKKCREGEYDSSSSSDSEYDNGCNNMCFCVEKHLKIDKPIVTICMPTDSPPIKIINTAPSKTMRANEIAIETAKTSNVTARVTVISIYCRKKCNLRSANPGSEKPSCYMVESAEFLEENSKVSKRPFSESEKRLDFEEIST
jgi:hypothetical protein